MNTFQSLPSNTKPLTVMGLMSGTSVDGVNACLAKLWMGNGQIHLADFCELNVAIGELFAKTALGLLRKFNIPASRVDCIGSHGQTIFHWPPTPEGLAKN